MRGLRDQQMRNFRTELSELIRTLGPDNGLVVRRQTRAADDGADDLLERIRNGEADDAGDVLTSPTPGPGPGPGPTYRFMWDRSKWDGGDLWGE